MLTTRQRGVTLVELLVSLVLAMLVVMAAVALYSATSSTSNTSNEEQGVQDNGRFALMLMSQSARHSGFLNLEVNSPVIYPANSQADGAKNAKVPTGTYSITSVGTASNRSSGDTGGDTLAFRYQAPATTDGTMPDCRGLNPTTVNKTDVAMSVYWVEADVDGEPALKCLSGSTSGTPAFGVQTLVRGVETLRVLYGVDTDSPPDSIPNQWMDATAVAALSPVSPATSGWGMVTAVRIGMVIRGGPGSGQPVAQTLYPLGQDFASTVSFAAPADGRLRKVFTSTYQLRNPQNWGL